VTKTRGNAEEGFAEGVAGLAVENGAAWGVGTGSWWLLILASAPATLQICKCAVLKLSGRGYGDNVTFKFKQMICDIGTRTQLSCFDALRR